MPTPYDFQIMPSSPKPLSQCNSPHAQQDKHTDSKRCTQRLASRQGLTALWKLQLQKIVTLLINPHRSLVGITGHTFSGNGMIVMNVRLTVRETLSKHKESHGFHGTIYVSEQDTVFCPSKRLRSGHWHKTHWSHASAKLHHFCWNHTTVTYTNFSSLPQPLWSISTRNKLA